MAFITYFLLFTVSSIIANIIYKGIRTFPVIETQSLLVLAVLVINVGSFIFIILMHLPTHPR
jgi:hypothetical protein